MSQDLAQVLQQDDANPLNELPDSDPFRKLLAHVLLRAIADFFDRRSKIERKYIEPKKGRNYEGLSRYREIEEYFYDRSQDGRPFSFTWIIQHLSDSPEETRLKILKYLENQDYQRIYHNRAAKTQFMLIAGEFAKTSLISLSNGHSIGIK